MKVMRHHEESLDNFGSLESGLSLRDSCPENRRKSF